MGIQGFFSFYLLFLLHVCVNCAAESCQTLSCSRNEIFVRFPFRLEGLQPQNCGYPGFNLTCNGNRKTVLNLPRSGDFLVRSVNYLKQEIQLYDSDNCMAKRLLELDLSDSPFVATFYQNLTFLSCPTQYVTSSFYPVDCLSNSTISVLATTSTVVVETMSVFCDIIATPTVPVSWPSQYDAVTTSLNEDILLTWRSPNCAKCEIHGGLCGFSGNSSSEIGCVNHPGKRSEGHRIFTISFLLITLPAIVLIAGVCGYAYASDRARRRAAGNIPEFSTTEMAQQPVSTLMGLDESTIESYEKVVLGESKRLPRPDDSTCAICLSEYKSKDTVRCIPECKHCFHADCIDEWLRIKGVCPVCRNFPSHAQARTQCL